jgi:formylglycine-generating enzyme required for sulfatase activity
VAGGVPSERATALVGQHGIDFLPDEEYLKILRLAGADDRLIAALREARKALTAPGTVKPNPKDGLKYVWIPPGTFMMGCSPGDTECGSDEKPLHRVTITNGFWMGQTEVTVGAYKRFAGATGRQMPPAPDFNGSWVNDTMPIVNVTWDDAHDYCAWAGRRLPSEAEWEYAARGGSTEARYGSIDEVAWYGANSGAQTHPGGEKRANGFGLYDMLGNVGERLNDWYDQNYYQNSPSQDPTGPASGTQRVLRGGSWGVNFPGFVRVSTRDKSIPGAGNNGVGVRCGGEVSAP